MCEVLQYLAGEALLGTPEVNTVRTWTAAWPLASWQTWIVVTHSCLFALFQSQWDVLFHQWHLLSLAPAVWKLRGSSYCTFCLHGLLLHLPGISPHLCKVLSSLSALTAYAVHGPALVWLGPWRLNSEKVSRRSLPTPPPLENQELLLIFHRSHCCNWDAVDTSSVAPSGRAKSVRVFLPQKCSDSSCFTLISDFSPLCVFASVQLNPTNAFSFSVIIAFLLFSIPNLKWRNVFLVFEFPHFTCHRNSGQMPWNCTWPPSTQFSLYLS